MSNIGFSFEPKSKQTSTTSSTRTEKERKKDHFLEYYHLVPDYLKIWPYDIVLVYCLNDRENIRLYLQNLSSIKLHEKHKIRATLFDNPKISFISETVRLSSFVFLYVTRDFLKNQDGWKHFSKLIWINDLIYNKKCIVVNFYGEKLPMGLNSLTSIDGRENFSSHSKRIHKLLEDHVKTRIQIENECREDIFQWVKCNVLRNPNLTKQGCLPKTKKIVERNGEDRLLNNEIITKRKAGDERKVQVVKPQVRPVPPGPQVSQNNHSLQSDGVSLPTYWSGEYGSVDNSLEIDGSGGYRADEFADIDSRTEPVIIHHHYHRQDTVINIYKDEREKLEIESRNRAKSSRRNKNRPKRNLSHQNGNSLPQQISSDFQISQLEEESFESRSSFPSLDTFGDILSSGELESREFCLHNDISVDGEIFSRNDGTGCQKIGDRRHDRMRDFSLESETSSHRNDLNSDYEAFRRNESCQKADHNTRELKIRNECEQETELRYNRRHKNSDHEFGTHTNKVNLQNIEDQTRDLEMSKQTAQQMNICSKEPSQTSDSNIGYGTAKQSEKMFLQKSDNRICDKELLKQTEQQLNMRQEPSPNLNRFLDNFLPNRNNRSKGNGHCETGYYKESYTIREPYNISDSNDADDFSDTEEEIVNLFPNID